jgi:peptidoglycan hydrolase-like protein with peptidoglycan-binding domain
VQAGDLHETPTGLWDAETRQAMKQYQSSNGFQPTGLPDAKSLMKLGLGPHPLPADVDPMARAKVGASAFSNTPHATASTTANP